MLPGQNGFDVCRKIKTHPELKNIPVIIVSAKEEELDMVLGLELGADDYVSKPFSPKVLFSRVKAVLRRGKENEKGQEHLLVGIKKNEKNGLCPMVKISGKYLLASVWSHLCMMTSLE